MNKIIFELNWPVSRYIKNFIKIFLKAFTKNILRRPSGFVTVQGPWRNGYEKISKHIKEIKVEPRPDVINKAKKPLPTPVNLFSNFSERWVVKLVDVIYNSSFGVAVASNYVILDTLRFPRAYSFLLPGSNRRLIKVSRLGVKPKVVTDQCTALEPGDSVIYGHFILYGLPRILRANALYPKCKTVLVSKICANFVRDFLEDLDFKVIEVETLSLCPNLIVTMDTLMNDVIIYPRDVEVIRGSISNVISDKSMLSELNRELIYIPRSKEKRGMDSDQEDILAISLSKIGFYQIDYRKLTVLSQIKYYAQAKIIVSQTGSGLANMVFLPQNALVVELGTPNELITTEIPMLANLLKLKHVYIELSNDYLESDTNLLALVKLVDKLSRNYLDNSDLPLRYHWIEDKFYSELD